MKKNLGKIILVIIIPFLLVLASCGNKEAKEFDVSTIRFTSRLYEYDGAEHSIEIEGKLPKGVRVSYSENKRSALGTTVVTATFDCSDSKYEQIDPMTAVISIAMENTNGLVYSEVADGIQITGYNSYLSSQIIIPDLIEGRPVVSIAANAFSNSELYAIRIPASVKQIDPTAFTNCPNLETIEVADGNVVYDSRDYCNAVVETATNKIIIGTNNCYIPDTIETIGTNAYSGRTGITNLYIPDSVKAVLSSAFSDCSGIKHLRLSNNLTRIKESCFENCIALEEIIIPDRVLYIESKAFLNCPNVLEIFIPKSVVYIYSSAFLYTSNAEKIVVDKENYIYDSRENCNGIIAYGNTGKYYLIVAGANTIVPEDVCIGTTTFTGASKLSSLYIPKCHEDRFSVTSFLGCISLKSISVNSENKVYDSRNDCNALIKTESNSLILGCSSTVIPDDVEFISSYAFQGCEGLEGIVIPDSVESISGRSFLECVDLKTVIIPKTCTIAKEAFYDCNKLTSIFYKGSAVDWILAGNDNIYKNDGSVETIVYYYSETIPPVGGNYWHYDANNKPVIWE